VVGAFHNMLAFAHKLIYKKNKILLLCVYFFSGFILMVKLFSAGGRKIAVGIIALIVTLSFALIAVADGLLLMKVR
jgi:hypothetical protein